MFSFIFSDSKLVKKSKYIINKQLAIASSEDRLPAIWLYKTDFFAARFAKTSSLSIDSLYFMVVCGFAGQEFYLSIAYWLEAVFNSILSPFPPTHNHTSTKKTISCKGKTFSIRINQTLSFSRFASNNWHRTCLPTKKKLNWIMIIIMIMNDASGSRCIGFSVKEAGRPLRAIRN